MKIEGLEKEGYFIWGLAESYLHLGGRVCTVERISDDNLFLTEIDEETSYFFTALKIISFVAIIPFITAHAICLFYRYTFTIIDIEGFQQMANEKIQFEGDQSFDFEFWAKEVRKSAMEKSWDENWARTSLPGFLSSQARYSKNIEFVANILFFALDGISRTDCSEQDIAFAKFVYKAFAQFLRQHQDTIELREEGHIYSKHLLFTKTSKISENKDLEALVTVLARNLRKRIKLVNKEKIENALQVEGIKTDLFPLLKLSWLHGTKLYALKNACKNTNSKLLPTGKLKKNNISPLTGEMQNGITAAGINVSSLSGVNLLNAFMCLQYASDYGFDINQEKNTITSFLASTIFVKTGTYEFNWDSGNSARTLTALHRIATQDQTYFDEKKEALLQKLLEIDTKIVEVFKDKRDVIFNPGYDLSYMAEFNSLLDFVKSMRDMLKTPPSPQEMSEDEKESATIPIVVASSNRFGIPRDLYLSSLNPEELYPGSMSLKRDIQVVFTTDEHIEKVKEFIKAQGLNSIAVKSIEQLKAAAKADEILGKKYYQLEKDPLAI